ncbi:ABC transporter ATP-binding protein [Pseudomonas sp. Marseille-QA0892]
MTTDTLLTLSGLSCGYGEQRIVQNLDLALDAGDIGCLLGPSGCGKTTTLRAIAGFEPLLEGQIELAGEVLSKPGFTLAPEKRRIGMVFQDYALFPHLTVRENISFGIRKLPARENVVSELLELVKLDPFANRHPHELSGGQQQRVALARALAPSPRLLLLDEPFSNLDVELRRSLSQEVRDILKARGTSAILVTHDQEEAFAVSDRVGVFQRGHLEQWATPHTLYHQPATPFVASFVGQGYFVRGTLQTSSLASSELGDLPIKAGHALADGTPVKVLLRPDSIIPSPNSELTARVASRVFLGAMTLYRLVLPSGRTVEALFGSDTDVMPLDEIGIEVKPRPLSVFPADAG